MSNEQVAALVDGGEEMGAPAAALEGDGLRGWAEALVDRARSEGGGYHWLVYDRKGTAVAASGRLERA